MTHEEKAKAYDKVREKITLRFGSNVAEEIFSEFEESEDERIRKVLVELVKCNEGCGYFMINNITTSSMLAWLEKQKAIEWSEEDNQTLGRIIAFLWFHRKGDTDNIYQQEKDINWLKSIHPHKCWKPSIAQLIALHQAIKEVNKGTADVLKGLYQQLKAI